MTPADPALEWFRDVVEPTVAEFLATPGDKRRGCLAALAIDAMVDHFYQARPDIKDKFKKVQAFRRSIWDKDRKGPPGLGRNATVSLLHDVANATKHVERFEPQPGKAGRMGYQDIHSSPLNTFGIARFGWPFSSEPEILVGENREWRLVELIDCAMIFWREKLDLPRSPTATERQSS